ncbi:MAG: hypothetical protein MUO40_04180 [Anaerolineaceae bacterium]|nr:hypothetical protein [Anaerolineaceae bacterium]
MKLHAESPELNNTKPDRMPSALLVSGFFLVSLFGFYGVIGLVEAARLSAFLLLIIILGVSAIYYGWFRKTRGSSSTKQLFKTTRQRIQIGATAGSVAAFLVYLVMQSEGLNISWVVSFIILSIFWALMFGIPAGGIGGLILASIWKNKKASFVGGAIAGALFSLFWILSYFGSLRSFV